MFRLNLGIFSSFIIIILLITSNGLNNLVNESPESQDLDFYKETKTLPESLPTEELLVMIDLSIKTEIETTKESQITTNLQRKQETPALIEGKSDIDSIKPNLNVQIEQNGTIQEEYSNSYFDNEPIEKNDNKFNNRINNQNNNKPEESKPSSKTKVKNTKSKIINPKSLYEQDKAGGSWVDSFNDDSGIDWQQTEYMRILNGQAGIDISKPKSQLLDAFTLAFWQFNEGTGQTVKDISGYDNHGILGSTNNSEGIDPTWVTGKNGNCLEFKNTNKERVKVPDSESLNITGAFKIEAWVNATGSSNELCIVDKYHHDTSASISHGYTLVISSGRLRLAIYSGANGKHDSGYGKSELRDNKWHYVMSVFNGTHKSMHVDGVCERTNRWVHPPAWTPQDLAIGRRLTGWGGYLNFNGKIDDVRISRVPYITSKPIKIPTNMSWDSLIINKTQYLGSFVNVTILNAANNHKIAGSPNYTADGEFDISYIDPIKYPSIRLRAVYDGWAGCQAPTLDYWGVSWNITNAWRDTLFGGLKGTSQDLTRGNGELWLPTSFTDWYKYSKNPILKVGLGSSWDNSILTSPVVVYNGSEYMMWYAGSGTRFQIGLATSKDGIKWTKYSGNPVITPGSTNSWEDEHVKPSCVLFDGKTYRMWYRGMNKNNTDWNTGLATSNDGINWKKHANNPVLMTGSSPSNWDSHYANLDDIYYDGIKYEGWYTGLAAMIPNKKAPYQIGYATSFDGINWSKYSKNPVLSDLQGWYTGINGFFVIIHNDQYFGYYNYKPTGGSPINIHHASSNDGINWIKYSKNPVLDRSAPGAWDDTTAVAPEIILKDKQYYMYYRGSDSSFLQIGLAKSKFSPEGSINSTIINLPKYQIFDQLILNKTEPKDTYINVSIIDAKTDQYIASFSELRGNTINISDLDLQGYTSIRLIANFSSNEKSTPILYNWAVTWRLEFKVSAGGPYFGIENSSIQLQANCTSKSAFLQYRWDLDNDGYYDDSTLANPIFTWSEDGIYTIKVEAFDGTFYAYDSTTVNVTNLPPEIYSTTYVYTLTQGTFSQTIPAVEKAQNASSFYNYYSESSHTSFEKAYESKVFLYRDITTNDISLIVTHDIDNSPSTYTRVDFDFIGIPEGAYVAQSDDPAHAWDPPRMEEFSLAYPDMEGHWMHNRNTDGGVLAGLPLNKTWAITIKPLYWYNINNWVYHFANGTGISLDMYEPITIAYKAQSEPTTVETFEGTSITLGAFARDWGLDDNPLNYEFTWKDPYTPNATSLGTTPWDTLFLGTHTYYENGIYYPVLTVTDSDGATDNLTFTVIVKNVAPNVTAEDDKIGNEGAPISFTGSFIDPGIYDTHNISWSFNDGNTSYGSLFTTHSFSQPGVYNVILTVTDDDGGIGSDNLTLKVRNLKPFVDAGKDIFVNEGEKFSFNASIENPGHDILKYFWDFDIAVDGLDPDTITDNDIDSQLLSTSHVYMDNNIYTAKLTVIDDDESVVTDFVNITVFDLYPIADAGSDQIMYSDENVTFNASSSYSYPDKIIRYTWDFGDGTNQSGLEVNHSYTSNGIYKVTLTVEDDDGSIDVDTAIVYINEIKHWCGYIAYEDLKKQRYCDYDFNDWGMMMYVKSHYRYDGYLMYLEFEFVGMLKEAGFNHKIFLGVGINKCVEYNWSTWHYNETDYMFWNELGSDSGDLNLTIFNYTGSNIGYSTVVKIEFDKPIIPSLIADLPFDPYMYVFDTKEEIHVGYNQTMSIRDAKGSNPFIGCKETPLVLIIELDDWTPPKECQRIWKAYPYFDDWIYSKRTEYLDWYKHPA